MNFLLIDIFNYHRDNAVSILVALADRKSLFSATVTSDVDIKRSLSRWQQQTSDLVNRFLPQAKEPLTMARIGMAMMPQLPVEWLSCHALLLTLATSVWDGSAHLQRHIDTIPHDPGTLWVCLDAAIRFRATSKVFHCRVSKTYNYIKSESQILSLSTITTYKFKSESKNKKKLKPKT